MITFDEIMSTVEREKMGVVVRHCRPESIQEAKAALKNHPGLKLIIKKTKDAGTCVAIAPQGFHAEEAIDASGHASLLRKLFKKDKTW